MRTSTEVKAVALDYLRTTITTKARALEIVPPPDGAWFPHGWHREPLQGEWPAVWLEELGESIELLERDDTGNPIFDCAWTLLLEVWVRGQRDQFHEASIHRGHLHRIATEALLDRPSLTEVGVVVDYGLVTEWPAMAKNKDGLPYASFALQFTVHTVEIVERPLLAEIDDDNPTIDVDLDVKPLEEP